MNIFAVDNDPQAAARALCDKHILKMIIESAQLLSTAHRLLDSGSLEDGNGSLTARHKLLLYKSTHSQHPSSIWARANYHNYVWLYQHFAELLREYTRRYIKGHKTAMLRDVLATPPKNIPREESITPFAQAMPEECKRENAVEAYRVYYRHKRGVITMAWKNNSPPAWLENNDT